MDSKVIALKDFGYQFLGPMCTQYFERLKALLSCFEEEDQPYQLVFLAREGYFFKRAYDALVAEGLMPDVKRSYIRVSRTFLFRICISDARTWDLSLDHKYEGKIENLLTHRFGFTGNQADRLFDKRVLTEDISLPQDIDKMKTLFESRIDMLRQLTIDSRSDYLSYLQSLDLTEGDLPVLIDVGYSGTIQKLLSILLNENTWGLYFMTTQSGTYDYDGAVAKMDFVFKDKVKMGEGYQMLDRSLFIESLLTSPHGQFLDIYARHAALGMSQAYQFVYGRESYTQTHFFELNTVHDGAIEAITHNFMHDIHFSVEEIEGLFEKYTRHRHMIPHCAYPLFDVDDAISGNGNVNPMNLFRL